MIFHTRKPTRVVFRTLLLVAIILMLMLPMEASAARKNKKRYPGMPAVSRDYVNIIKWMLVALFGPMLVYFFYSLASDPTLPSLLWRAIQRLGNRMYGYLGEGRGEHKPMTTTSTWGVHRTQERLQKNDQYGQEKSFKNKLQGHLYPRPIPPQSRSHLQSNQHAQYAPAAGPVGGNLVSQRSQWGEQHKAASGKSNERGHTSRAVRAGDTKHVHWE